MSCFLTTVALFSGLAGAWGPQKPGSPTAKIGQGNRFRAIRIVVEFPLVESGSAGPRMCGVRQLIGGIIVLLLLACGDEGGGGDGTGASGPPGRGTVACQDWQDAICDLAADECGGVSRAVCDDQYKAFECLSDEQASACANELQQATCVGVPAGCDYADIADPAPAIAKCEAVVGAVCELSIRCGVERTLDDCVQMAPEMLGITCSQALGVALEYETCIERLANAPCEPDDEILSAVASCTSVILLIR